MKAKIVKLDNFGRGITKVDDIVTFVPYTLPEEEVEIDIKKHKKTFNEAACSNIYLRSDNRKANFCPHFMKCGGCSLQHMSYEDSLNFKIEKVNNILKRAKIDFPKLSIIKSPKDKYYRNKLTLKVVNAQVGFYENESHNIVEIDKCFIANEAINACINELKTKILVDGEIVIRTNSENELLIIFKGNYNFNIDDFSKKLKIVGIVINDKIVYGVDYLITNINNVVFKYSYNSFFQVNNDVASYIFDCVKKEVFDGVVLDLYCGVGTLSLMASYNAKKVYGIEIIPNAIKNAKENANLNSRNNITFLCGDVAQLVRKIDDDFDMIIVDPPRKGLDKITMEFLMNSGVKQIVYVSCDPVTLARDLVIMQNKYNIKQIKLFDMFPYTYHVESFVLLERKPL